MNATTTPLYPVLLAHPVHPVYPLRLQPASVARAGVAIPAHPADPVRSAVP
jgi:hypothetical protein